MQYYKLKKEANEYIETMIAENQGNVLPLANLQIKFMRLFGFSKTSLLKMLEPFQELGVLSVEGPDIRIHKLDK